MTPSGARLAARKGDIPYITLPMADSSHLDLWQYKGRRNLVLFLAHSADCSGCREYLKMLASRYSDWQLWEAEVLALIPGRPDDVLDLACLLNLPYQAIPDLNREISGKLGLAGESGPHPSQAGLLITDRWGEIYESSSAGEGHELPTDEGIMESLRFIEIQCPECGVGGWRGPGPDPDP